MRAFEFAVSSLFIAFFVSCSTAAAEQWQFCSQEVSVPKISSVPSKSPFARPQPQKTEGRCFVPYATKVRYGADGAYVYRDMSAAGDFFCSNAVFGDPLVGKLKQCSYRVRPELHPLWVRCAYENGFCAFVGTRSIRYGAKSAFAMGKYANGVMCSNKVFGDPLVGVPKFCEVYR